MKLDVIHFYERTYLVHGVSEIMCGLKNQTKWWCRDCDVWTKPVYHVKEIFTLNLFFLIKSALKTVFHALPIMANNKNDTIVTLCYYIESCTM